MTLNFVLVENEQHIGHQSDIWLSVRQNREGLWLSVSGIRLSQEGHGLKLEGFDASILYCIEGKIKFRGFYIFFLL